MGEKAREIITGDKEWTISKLKKAYAHEWVVHYYASIAAKIVAGPHAATFEKIFEETAEEEYGHTKLIADRLSELGEEPPRNLNEIPTIAGTENVALPSNSRDINGFLKAFIALEAHAISLYKELAEKTRMVDIATHELAEDLLVDEIKDEEKFENLME